MWNTYGGINLPPRKWCFPLKNLAAIFGAVKETNISGSKPTLSIFPCSTFHPDGISIETIGKEEAFKVYIK